MKKIKRALQRFGIVTMLATQAIFPVSAQSLLEPYKTLESIQDFLDIEVDDSRALNFQCVSGKNPRLKYVDCSKFKEDDKLTFEEYKYRVESRLELMRGRILKSKVKGASDREMFLAKRWMIGQEERNTERLLENFPTLDVNGDGVISRRDDYNLDGLLTKKDVETYGIYKNLKQGETRTIKSSPQTPLWIRDPSSFKDRKPGAEYQIDLHSESYGEKPKGVIMPVYENGIRVFRDLGSKVASYEELTLSKGLREPKINSKKYLLRERIRRAK